MRVNCENCNTSFNLDDGLVKTTGSKVRCSKCRHIFVVYPSPPVAEEPVIEAPVTDAAETSQAPVDEFESAGQEAQDAEVSEGAEAPDDSLLDEEPAEETEGDDLDLSDIERMLEAEEKSEAPAELPEEGLTLEEAGEGDGEASLDLSDIEKILDEEDDNDELAEERADEDEDLVFDLDEELELEAGEEQISPTTELDLGDLEKMFESDEGLEPSEDQDTAVSLDLEDEDGNLSLMLESEEGETGETSALEMEEEAAAPSDSGDASAFHLEPVEEEDTFQMAEEEEVPSLEIEGKDFSLEETLEVGEIDAESLEMEVDSETEAPAAEVEDLTLEGEIELETSELETDALELKLGDQEEELEDLGGMPQEALESEADEDGLTDFGEEAEMEYPDEAVPEIPDEEEAFGDEVSDFGVGPVEDQETEEDIEEILVEGTAGAGVKKLLGLLAVVLVIILLLATILFLHYKEIIDVPFLDRVQIPFLTKQKASQVADAGNLNITYAVEGYRFLETEKAGRLFLITGTVKNEYSMPRSYVQMSGSLYNKGKTLADTATAYCGNVIADLELTQMTPAAIRTRLGNRSGENNSNVNIKPGEERPFMIVFFDLPGSLDEFTVSVAGSFEGDE